MKGDEDVKEVRDHTLYLPKASGTKRMARVWCECGGKSVMLSV